VRSALHSLGALGYYLLTGRAVFDGDSIAELCRKHLTETPVAPGRRIGKVFDPQLESLLMHCLEKDPAARPQSARELARLLSACPAAAEWTPESRDAWWMEHRKSISGLVKPADHLAASEMDKTVKIEFADRTT
jgi:serine/threonine protein kinase